MYYLIPYCAMSLGAFGVVAARERELGAPVTLDNLSGFGWERPLLGVSMWVFMLGLPRLPAHRRLLGEDLRLRGRLRHGWWWLIVIGVVVHDGLRRLLPGGRALDVPPRQRRAAAWRRPAARRRASWLLETGVAICAIVSRSARSSSCSRWSTSRRRLRTRSRSDPVRAFEYLEQSDRLSRPIASSPPQARPGAPSRRGRARPEARARVSRTGRGREAPFDRRRRPPRSRG